MFEGFSGGGFLFYFGFWGLSNYLFKKKVPWSEIGQNMT